MALSVFNIYENFKTLNENVDNITKDNFNEIDMTILANTEQDLFKIEISNNENTNFIETVTKIEKKDYNGEYLIQEEVLTVCKIFQEHFNEYIIKNVSTITSRLGNSIQVDVMNQIQEDENENNFFLVTILNNSEDDVNVEFRLYFLCDELEI